MDRDRKQGALDDTVDATVKPASSNAETLADLTEGAATPMPVSWPAGGGGPLGGSGSLARYTLGAVLGRGGMGEVVSARDEQIGRSVAIKRMRADKPTQEQTARFLREARIQGRLDHPAVVPVHELWHDDRGQPFFVMKQLAGVTLAEVIDKLAAGDADAAKKYPRQRLLRAFADVCLAIEFAHTKHVVHRDLKPANIVLGDFGEVYVLDWGIARVLGDREHSFDDVPTLDETGTVAGAVIGTPGYMSPEQVHAVSDLDGRSDVYALGAILFELLALVPLHPRGGALVTTIEGVDGRPSRRAPEREIAPELDAICLAATMLDRADRYAAARELGDAVQRFLDGDRDLALRRDLAAAELATARAALDRGNGDDERRIAIRAAARALALDPSAPEPAELVGKLMLEPPATMPPEVETELTAIEDDAMRAQARLGTYAVGAYFMFFPIFYAAGFRFDWYMVVGPIVVAILLVMTRILVVRPTNANAWASYWINIVVLVLVSRVTSPFLLGTGMAVITSMIYTMHPRFGPWWLIAFSSIAAILLPLGAEAVGLFEPSLWADHGNLVVHLPSDALDGRWTLFGLILYVLSIVSMSTIMSRTLALKQRSIQRSLHVQAWQLRQLVPR